MDRDHSRMYDVMVPNVQCIEVGTTKSTINNILVHHFSFDSSTSPVIFESKIGLRMTYAVSERERVRVASPRIMRDDGTRKAQEEGKKTSFSILDERVIRKAIEKSSYYILQLLQLANVHSKRSKHEIKEEDEYGKSASGYETDSNRAAPFLS